MREGERESEQVCEGVIVSRQGMFACEYVRICVCVWASVCVYVCMIGFVCERLCPCVEV
jgi:hypothetical protein